MSTKLSVNINKIATLRNARGGNNPDIVQAAINIQNFGAEGITVHPRPDERHIRYSDVFALKKVVHTEFNIEGYPDEKFLQLVEEIRPEQVTLVPDSPDVLTSNAGWDTIKNLELLTDIIARLHNFGMRVSVFLDPKIELLECAKKSGTDRIELYTERYASNYRNNKETAISDYVNTAKSALEMGLGINAGHDLDLENLHFFASKVPGLLEVSIGHALVCDALQYGMQNAVQMYKARLADGF